MREKTRQVEIFSLFLTKVGRASKDFFLVGYGADLVLNGDLRSANLDWVYALPMTYGYDLRAKLEFSRSDSECE